MTASKICTVRVASPTVLTLQIWDVLQGQTHAILVNSNIIDTIRGLCKHNYSKAPEIQVSLNDLPENDFNSVFKSLPPFYDKLKNKEGEEEDQFAPCFVSGCARFFLWKAFPKKQPAFCSFLLQCSLALSGALQIPPQQVAVEGLIQEADINSFNLPFYTPYKDEVKTTIETDGSFIIDRLEAFEPKQDPRNKDDDDDYVFDKSSFGRSFAKAVRAIVEPMLASHFGHSIMDNLFERFAVCVAEHLAVEKTKSLDIVVALKKR
ncbi:unnamed protein product [Ilex paraguariensis]|uniref:Uncharacterized protein n=1 Tax=Ilex paraguariensis TaxID=185542 RepID=A0ABC8UNU1_9AQUA